MDDKLQKSFAEDAWETLKSGFKPVAERADDRVKAMRQETGDQFAKDKAQGAASMKQKFVKGFLR